MRQRRLDVATLATPARPRRPRRRAKHSHTVRRLQPWRRRAALRRREQVRRRPRVAAHAHRVVEEDVEAERRARHEVRHALRSRRVVRQRHQDAEKHPDHALCGARATQRLASPPRRAAAAHGRTRMSVHAANTYAGPAAVTAAQAPRGCGRALAFRRPVCMEARSAGLRRGTRLLCGWCGRSTSRTAGSSPPACKERAAWRSRQRTHGAAVARSARAPLEQERVQAQQEAAASRHAGARSGSCRRR